MTNRSWLIGNASHNLGITFMCFETALSRGISASRTVRGALPEITQSRAAGPNIHPEQSTQFQRGDGKPSHGDYPLYSLAFPDVASSASTELFCFLLSKHEYPPEQLLARTRGSTHFTWLKEEIHASFGPIHVPLQFAKVCFPPTLFSRLSGSHRSGGCPPAAHQKIGS